MNLQDQTQVKAFYEAFASRCASAREKLGRPLTLTEKILAAHLDTFPENFAALERGKSHIALRPDRVAMQDATAQMALLQYIQAGLKEVAVPTSIHCDHLIRARAGSFKDLTLAQSENVEVYEFLRSAAARHGIAFGAAGKGIIHQVVLENLAFPGGLIIGTDSHTPNAGGLSMLAIGVGGADAVEVMAGEPWSLSWPTLIGVRLTGKLNGWASAKDVILKLAGILGSSGGTGSIIEYFGAGTGTMSCTGQATIANMGAELGATTSTFPFSAAAATYLRATNRASLAAIAEGYADHLRADPEVEANPEKYFDRVIEIDLTTLEPHVVGPYTPDLARPISQLAAEVKAKGYPETLRFALIGSCTNSSYEDMGRAAHIARQAADHGLKARCGFLITPGSTQIHDTIERDGQMETLQSVGGQVMANACGPCIGQWQRNDVADNEPNSIINSFNRPFKGRNDNNGGTHAFIASPEIVTAFALAGTLAFNPLTDELIGADGKPFKLTAPTADELPPQGFVTDADAITPARYNELTQVAVKPDSDRLQLLAPFDAFAGEHQYSGLPVLLKATGKCTTDHISPAGVQWLKFRGHLDKISDNMFSRAVNAFAGQPGTGVNQLTGNTEGLSAIARQYKAAGLGWVAIGDVNYGEGSSREHAAMSPRFLGCKAVIVRSFARIHRSNLQKQGLLALTFADPADYDKIGAQDRVTIKGLTTLEPGRDLTLVIQHQDGSTSEVPVVHGLTAEQIDWFKAGSFLNLVRQRREAAEAAKAMPATKEARSDKSLWSTFWSWLRGLFGG
ncbi:MAG: aconitate hydratase [Cyanobacteria bacterium SZAS LIN-2]|nr:aconitate hydratase [Cyanobacteria bacterium SZAS LIN-2]